VRTVRLFVSSPGDVEHERQRVERVAERLNSEFMGIARIETIRRETSFYSAQSSSADAGFQSPIPAAVDCDVVLAIFWSRLGSALPPDFPRMPSGEPYPSGTAYEVLTAIKARESKDLPNIFVFRKTERPRVPIDDEAELARAQTQWRRLQSFFDNWVVDPQGHSRAALQSFETADGFEDKIEALLRDWVEGHVVPGRSVAWPIATKGSPFRGLAPFDVEHAPVFFGRSRDVTRAIDRLNAAASRNTPFLLVVGASGVGKSSLVRAGLVPRLTAPGVAAGVDVWRAALLRPGARPPAALAEALLDAADGDAKMPQQLSALLANGGDAGVDALLRALDRVGAVEQARGGLQRTVRADLLLVVDQLDDLFAADVPAADRAAFSQVLRALVLSGRVWVVATLRGALYERFLQQADLKSLKDAGAAYDLGPPEPADLAEIVRKPAEAAGLTYETDPAGATLDEALLRDAAGADTLPLLQFMLQGLFVGRQMVGQERRLTFAACEALGRLDGAIDQAAERAFLELGEAEQAALPQLLRQLVISMDAVSKAGASSGVAVRAVPLADVTPNAAARHLVEALAGARVLLLWKERGVPTIQLAHQCVLERWQRARRLVANNFEPSGVGRSLQKPSRRVHFATAAAAALAIVAAIAGWQYFAARTAKETAERAQSLAVIERDRAEQQRQLAETQRDEAEEHRRIALAQQNQADAQRAIAQRQQQAAAEQQAVAHRQQEESERRRKAVEAERNRALIAESRFLADLADQKRKAGDDVTAALLAIEALPDEKAGLARPLVAEARANLDRAWRAQGSERPRETRSLGGHTDAVLTCALSRDGLRAVTASSDRTIRLWDIRTGAALAGLEGHSDDVAVVLFNADGSRIISAAQDGIRVWDAASHALLAFLPQKRSLIAVSEDGRGVVSTSAANRLQIWDANTRQESSRTMNGPILAVRFGQEGARALVAAADNSIELYEAASGRRLRVLRGHARKPLNASFSPDGQRIASIGDDQTARIWNAADGRQLFALSDPKLSRDLAVRLVADRALVPFDFGFRLHALEGARRLADLPVGDGKASVPLASPDGRFVVATSAAGANPSTSTRITLWDSASGKELAAMEQPSTTTCVDISQDGRQLLIGARDGTGRIWSVGQHADLDQPPDDTLQRLLEFSKAHVPRCLTPEQREKAFLGLEPPAWCIEMAKWPYDTPAWKDWLRYKRDHAAPPLPTTSEWRPWLAARNASEGQTTHPASEGVPSSK
jgi:WD40 repeat protein